jgi:hypothetical protein
VTACYFDFCALLSVTAVEQSDESWVYVRAGRRRGSTNLPGDSERTRDGLLLLLLLSWNGASCSFASISDHSPRTGHSSGSIAGRPVLDSAGLSV